MFSLLSINNQSDEGKSLVNTKGVYGSKFGNETHFLSFAAIVATRNGQRARIFMSEMQRLPELYCLATGWLASLAETARRCSPTMITEPHGIVTT